MLESRGGGGQGGKEGWAPRAPQAQTPIPRQEQYHGTATFYLSQAADERQGAAP